MRKTNNYNGESGMVRYILVLLLGLSGLSYGENVYSIVANIGKYAITSYDINQMYDFELASSGKPNTDTNYAFKELLLNYSLFYMADKNDKVVVHQQELDSVINSITNITNLNDPGVELRRRLFQEYPDQYRDQVKKQQIIRSLLYYDQDVKERINAQLPEKELRNFYDSNSNAMVEPASVDIIVVGAVQPTNLSLTELEKFDNTLSDIAEALKKTNDIDSILIKTKNIRFESYSGRTGLKSIYDLYSTAYPEEVLAISTMEKIQLNSLKTIIMTNGAIFGPQLVPIKKRGKNVVLIIKLLDRQPPKIMSFEKARSIIENKLKEERVQSVIQQLVIDKVIKGEIPVNIHDNNYQGAYDEFIRR